MSRLIFKVDMLGKKLLESLAIDLENLACLYYCQLSAMTPLFGSFGLRELTYTTSFMALLWTIACFQLGYLVPSREEADNAYRKMKAS